MIAALLPLGGCVAADYAASSHQDDFAQRQLNRHHDNSPRENDVQKAERELILEALRQSCYAPASRDSQAFALILPGHAGRSNTGGGGGGGC